jgi:DNA-binding LacI/PurR family transcriptional regulator
MRFLPGAAPPTPGAGERLCALDRSIELKFSLCYASTRLTLQEVAPISIAEVAVRAGVSKATVSLVINNKPNISAATVARVQAVMAEMGYTPPPLERRPGRRQVVQTAALRIALLAWMPVPYLLSPVYSDVLRGVEAALTARKGTLLLVNETSDIPPTLDTTREALDGLLLFSGYPHATLPAACRALPTVRLMGEAAQLPQTDHVTYDNRAVGALAAQHFLRGHHTQCAVLDYSGTPLINTRVSVFRDSLAAAGMQALTVHGEGLLAIHDDRQIVVRDVLLPLIDRLLAATPRPTGLFLTADLLAPSVYLALLERGIQPGRDIEIVTCNNERPLLDSLHPRPTIIDIHAYEVGYQAVEQLFWRLAHPHAPQEVRWLVPVLLAGER